MHLVKNLMNLKICVGIWHAFHYRCAKSAKFRPHSNCRVCSWFTLYSVDCSHLHVGVVVHLFDLDLIQGRIMVPPGPEA